MQVLSETWFWYIGCSMIVQSFGIVWCYSLDFVMKRIHRSYRIQLPDNGHVSQGNLRLGCPLSKDPARCNGPVTLGLLALPIVGRRSASDASDWTGETSLSTVRKPLPWTLSSGLHKTDTKRNRVTPDRRRAHLPPAAGFCTFLLQ